MSELSGKTGFFVAPFAIDGELMGLGEWQLTNLSPQWLEYSQQLLASGGKVFHSALLAPLERVVLRFTAADGAALATFHIVGQLVASAVYLRGDNLGVEQELLGMFVESLRQTAVVQQSRTSAEPFGDMFAITQRPLHIVVSWGKPGISEEDEELVQQVGTHLAGAFLCR